MGRGPTPEFLASKRVKIANRKGLWSVAHRRVRCSQAM